MILAVFIGLVTTTSVSASDVLASGQFRNASGHDTSGSVQLVKTKDGMRLVLGKDFDHDGAPDPKVGFGVKGEYDSRSKLGALRSNKGEQVYQVPASLQTDGYDEVYIWCERYGVPLGVAKIR